MKPQPIKYYNELETANSILRDVPNIKDITGGYKIEIKNANRCYIIIYNKEIIAIWNAKRTQYAKSDAIKPFLETFAKQFNNGLTILLMLHPQKLPLFVCNIYYYMNSNLTMISFANRIPIMNQLKYNLEHVSMAQILHRENENVTSTQLVFSAIYEGLLRPKQLLGVYAILGTAWKKTSADKAKLVILLGGLIGGEIKLCGYGQYKKFIPTINDTLNPKFTNIYNVCVLRDFEKIRPVDPASNLAIRARHITMATNKLRSAKVERESPFNAAFDEISNIHKDSKLNSNEMLDIISERINRFGNINITDAISVLKNNLKK